MKEQIIGQYDLAPENMPAEGMLEVRVKPIDMVTYWKRCSAVADFVARFYNVKTTNHASENLISTVFNEMIENAAKYSTKRDSEIHVEVKLYNTILKIQVQNVCNKLHCDTLINRLSMLLSPETDLDELYVKEMELKMNGSKESGIGLLMLLKDFQMNLGLKIVDLGSDLFQVNFRVFYLMQED
jgi:hypothetical protein